MNVNLEDIADELPLGWAKIAQQLVERLRPAVAKGLVILQVKEKFGGLRVYTTGAKCPDIDDLEAASRVTCFVCGEPGEMCYDGWIVPRCTRHASL